jgi:glutamate formiminotransferase
MHHLRLGLLRNLTPWLARLPTTDSSYIIADGVHRSFMSLQGSQKEFTRANSEPRDAALACNVYISQGRDEKLIQNLVKEISTMVSQIYTDTPIKPVQLGHVFVDTSYNRTGFTLVGSSMDAVVQGAAALSRAALSCIDLREHDATHPRLGVVDHVSCHPLRRESKEDMEIAVECARKIALILGDECGVPTFLYGTCKKQEGDVDTSLASIRRKFGYFKTHGSGSDQHQQEWKGLSDSWLATMNSVIVNNPPDFGPNTVSAHIGIACVGSVPWMINHNVVLNTLNIDIAKAVAKKVSERGGGLKAVQAMGLEIDGGVEVACNLLDSAVSNCTNVDEFITEMLLKNYKGIHIVKSYQTGMPVSELLNMINQIN